MAVTLISGGTVVSAVGRRLADVLIDGEKVAAILAPGQAASMGVNADRTIDATGKYVVPGGVDVHTHMQLPFGGTEASDTFETGTRAAAWGGVTTIVDFAVQKTGESVQETLAAWHDKAAGECAIDYGFHQIIGGVDDTYRLRKDGHLLLRAYNRPYTRNFLIRANDAEYISALGLVYRQEFNSIQEFWRRLWYWSSKKEDNPKENTHPYTDKKSKIIK